MKIAHLLVILGFVTVILKSEAFCPCTMCLSMIRNIKTEISSKRFKFLAAIKPLAKLIVCKSVQPVDYCERMIDGFGDIVLNSLVMRTISEDRICIGLFMCEPKQYRKESPQEFVKNILKDMPPKNIPTPSKKKTYKVVTITDIHVDLDYEEGANAFCEKEICCRKDSGIAPTPQKAAKYWGTSSKCDIPLRTAEEGIRFINDEIKPDIVLWNGDNIAHNM